MKAKEIKKPQVIESEHVFSRPWLTARRDKLLMPTGAVNSEFYVLEYPDWVNIIAITEDERFVMVRQYRHGLGVIETELCAGCVEPGEEPLEAAQRELLEETGYTGGEWELQCVISGNPSTTNNLTYCYLARGVRPTGTQHLDATEDIEVLMLSRDELLGLMNADAMKQALMLAPLWRYFYLEEKNGNRQI